MPRTNTQLPSQLRQLVRWVGERARARRGWILRFEFSQSPYSVPLVFVGPGFDAGWTSLRHFRVAEPLGGPPAASSIVRRSVKHNRVQEEKGRDHDRHQTSAGENSDVLALRISNAAVATSARALTRRTEAMSKVPSWRIALSLKDSSLIFFFLFYHPQEGVMSRAISLPSLTPDLDAVEHHQPVRSTLSRPRHIPRRDLRHPTNSELQTTGTRHCGAQCLDQPDTKVPVTSIALATDVETVSDLQEIIKNMDRDAESELRVGAVFVMERRRVNASARTECREQSVVLGMGAVAESEHCRRLRAKCARLDFCAVTNVRPVGVPDARRTIAALRCAAPCTRRHRVRWLCSS